MESILPHTAPPSRLHVIPFDSQLAGIAPESPTFHSEDQQPADNDMTIQFPAVHHIISQLKFVVPGGALTWYLDTVHQFQRTYDGAEGIWGRNAAFGALSLGLTTIALFIYVLLTPWLKGIEPNYKTWRESGTLSSVIPVMTSTIVVGFLLLIVTLGHWSPMGYLQGFIGATALYTLTFGLLGLIPAPKIKRK